MKTILITGCSSGIGLDAAKTLKERGYRVLATARKQEDVENLEKAGFETWLMDLADLSSIEQAINRILEACDNQLDFLFNNGAYGQPGALEDLPTEVLIKQFNTNVFGWHHLTRIVLKVMLAQGHGRIVQNSSVLGVVSMPFRGAYNASKYAIEGLTDTLRLELSGTNVHAILIEPGPIISKFRANALMAFKENIRWQESRFKANYLKQIEKLEKEGPVAPFTLGPEAVTAHLIHALESPRPRARYRTTFATKLFAALKRLLPTRVLDKILKNG